MNRVRDIRKKLGLMHRFKDYVIDKSGVKTVEIINASFETDEPYIIREPNKDYIVCADDYSDLINIMESLSPEKAKEIGDNVKKKMNDNYKPKPFWDYVINTMEKFYG